MNNRNTYNKSGYVIARQFFTTAEISVLAQSVDRIYQQWLLENEANVVEYDLINMHGLTSRTFFKNNPAERVAFFKAIALPKLQEFIENIFGAGIYFHNSQLFFNPRSDTFLPYWHRDIQYNQFDEATQKKALVKMLSLHVRIPLIEETGLELVPGTHKRWDTDLEYKVRMQYQGHINSEQLPGAELMHLNPGDIIVFSANMLHRGNYALNNTRKALDLCIGKQHDLLAGSPDPGVLPTDQEMQEIGDNSWYKLARQIATGGL